MVHKQNRRAVTLIELLVVIAILGILFGMGILFFPDIEQQSRTANGAIALQGWLDIAKQRAQRDRVPHGLRLLADASNDKYVIECQYIEQPDPFSQGTITTAAGNSQVIINGVDLFGGAAQNEPHLHLVQVGDYLELLDSGLVHRIDGIAPAAPPPPPQTQYTLTLASNVPFAIAASSNYRIIRQPRVVGEEKLKLPVDVIIDLQTNQDYGSTIISQRTPPPANTILHTDILFSPSGEVIGDQTTANVVMLWVRDRTLSLVDGEPSIIAVRTQSGQIAAFPVDITDAVAPNGTLDHPYNFVTQ